MINYNMTKEISSSTPALNYTVRFYDSIASKRDRQSIEICLNFTRVLVFIQAVSKLQAILDTLSLGLFKSCNVY